MTPRASLPVLAAFAWLACLAPALAERISAPAGVSVELPEGWKTEQRGGRLSAYSPDEDAFVMILPIEPGSNDAMRAQVGTVLQRSFAEVSLLDSGQKLNIGGLPALLFVGAGSVESVNIVFRLAVLSPPQGAPVLVLASASQELEGGGDLVANLIASILPAP